MKIHSVQVVKSSRNLADFTPGIVVLFSTVDVVSEGGLDDDLSAVITKVPATQHLGQISIPHAYQRRLTYYSLA